VQGLKAALDRRGSRRHPKLAPARRCPLGPFCNHNAVRLCLRPKVLKLEQIADELPGTRTIQRRGVACCIRSLLWRIRPDVNVKPVPPPVRKINSKRAAVLNARRAGNRGSSKRRLKTTPVFG
jgi:hypothetical protein